MESSVRTAALECAYIERGPADGPAVVLVHGFPDDAHTWDPVAQGLAEDGFRTIAPFVRGFGPTRIRAGSSRSGEIAAVARDVLDLADALGLERFHYVGHDWGARAGYTLAGLASHRLRSLSTFAVAYGTNVSGQALDVHQLRAYWYQWYFATPRGERALREERHAFCRDLWRTWSPGWNVSAAEYDATAASFENPDFVEVVLHSYRQRWGFAPGDAVYAADRAVLEALPPVALPTLVLMGADDGATLPESAAGTERFFRGAYDLRIVPGSGHFVQRERPDFALAALREHLGRQEGRRP
ncbi:MAG: alpha/beta hydrolase [Candidatus Velthaea sp.]